LQQAWIDRGVELRDEADVDAEFGGSTPSGRAADS